MSLRFLSPIVVTNECDRIWRGAMFAGLLLTALGVLPAVALDAFRLAAFVAAIVGVLCGVAIGATIIGRRFDR